MPYSLVGAHALGFDLARLARGRQAAAVLRTALTADDTVTVPGFPVEAVDTTGAGDAFTATMLTGLARAPDLTKDRNALVTLLKRANAAGAIISTRLGAIASMPTAEDIDSFLAARP